MRKTWLILPLALAACARTGDSGGETFADASQGIDAAGAGPDAGCEAPRSVCADECVDVATDLLNCGSCGHVCELGEACLDAVCVDQQMANWPVPPDAPTDYVGHGDEAVSDRVTGLVWQKRIETTGFDRLGARSYCRSLRLDGRADWRVPTRIELLSIQDLTVDGPTINRRAFPNTPGDGWGASQFWTATMTPTSNNIWFVNFWLGGAGSEWLAENSAYSLRCVAGAAKVPVPRYAIGVDTVLDNGTGLTWQRTVRDLKFTWSGAGDYCRALRLGGFDSGWRLPTAKELETLVDVRRQDPALDPEAFPCPPGLSACGGLLWTSTPFPHDPGFGRTVAFYLGYDEACGPGGELAVRCVR